MLILFDIDGTLLKGDGVGMRALTAAAQDLFGPDFTSDGISYAGRLDPLIVDELFIANDLEPTPARRAELKDSYIQRLRDDLSVSPIHALPGAKELVQHLADKTPAVVGLLTGNFPESGQQKLHAAGFDVGTFEIKVWGDDSPHTPPHRNDLPQVAADRYATLHGTEINPERVIVIGDTPGDVECAHHYGGRCLGVTTGRHGMRHLCDAGADRIVKNLENTDDLTRWILEPCAAKTGTGR